MLMLCVKEALLANICSLCCPLVFRIVRHILDKSGWRLQYTRSTSGQSGEAFGVWVMGHGSTVSLIWPEVLTVTRPQ